MSIYRNVYVILGYDLSEYEEQIMTEDFVNSDRGEKLIYQRVKGNVQLFDDPVAGNYLYLGYILGNIKDDYTYTDYEMKNIMSEFEEKRKEVDKVLIELIGKKKELPFEHIIFTEWG